MKNKKAVNRARVRAGNRKKTVFEHTPFFKNLEYIKNNLGLTEDDFCKSGDYPGWIPIGKSSYGKYRVGAYPSPQTLAKITEAINIIIEEDETLHKRFPRGILPIELRNENIAELAIKDDYSYDFYSEKMAGVYICYYESTNVEGAKKRQYGILQLMQKDSKTEMSACGVFSLRNYEQASKLYNAMMSGATLKDCAMEMKNTVVFEGSGFLTYSFLWIHLATRKKNEFVSMSFDLSEKVLSKNPLRPFSGALGSAHSQTTGASLQTTHFPMIITRKPLSLCDSEIAKHLHFSYDVNADELHTAAEKTISLLEKLSEGAFSKTTTTELLVTMMEQQLEALVRDKYRELYFSSNQLKKSYSDMFSALRNIDEKVQ